MKHLSEPMIAIAIVALLVMAFLGKAIFRLISMVLLVTMVGLAYYVYKHDQNLAGQVHHFITTHLPTTTIN